MKPLTELRKEPYTAEELFLEIVGILKEKNECPNILDYGTAPLYPILNDNFSLESELHYGGNEGIYLDIVLLDYENKRRILGTFKTLQESKDAMRIMATLGADFIVEGSSFIREHSDDFSWTGYNVYAIRADGHAAPLYYTLDNPEKAMNRAKEILQQDSVQHVIIRDNGKKKDRVITREDLA